MFQYVYVSSAVQLFNETQLQELLEISRTKNESCGVTGLLLYLNGNFIQLLEGQKADVVAIRDRILVDPRHRGIITLLEADAEKRSFPNWSMGFERVEGPNAADIPGYSDFLQQVSEPGTERTGALKLLEFFRDINVNQTTARRL